MKKTPAYRELEGQMINLRSQFDLGKKQYDQLSGHLIDLINLINGGNELTAETSGAEVMKELGKARGEIWRFRSDIRDREREISNLGEQLTRARTDAISVRAETVKNENARVWYMLRAITGDPTLRKDLNEQVDHQRNDSMRPTPFDKPTM